MSNRPIPDLGGEQIALRVGFSSLSPASSPHRVFRNKLAGWNASLSARAGSVSLEDSYPPAVGRLVE
jgi:hypothetical protein